MKVGFVIITYNILPEIFLLQIKCIKKFCEDENFEINIIDNSSDLELAEHIRYHCEQLGLSYLKTFSSSQNSSDSHSFAANLAFQKFKDDYDLMCFLDHDCLPILPFSAEQILIGGHVLAGIGQGAKKKYLWPGCLFIANNSIDTSLVDFSPSREYGLDTGGNLYVIVDIYSQGRCVFFNEAYYQNPNYSGQGNHYALINNGGFAHLSNGSNWASKERHEERLNSFVNLIREKTGIND